MDKDGKASIKQIQEYLARLDEVDPAELDAEADRFLTALAQKDYATLAELCETWGVTEDSVPGYLIARIAAPLVLEDDGAYHYTPDDPRVVNIYRIGE